jgi:hypothetical protein
MKQDVRLMTQEFNDVMRLLDAAESTRVEPFAVDAENRAYFNFGFKVICCLVSYVTIL